MSISEQVARLERERDELRWDLRKVMSERDALQARIDGGVRVYRDKDYRWIPEDIGCTATGLLIDRELLHAQPIADATEIVEERVGKADRRYEFMHPRCGGNPRYGNKPIRSTDTVRWVATIEHARSNDRRSTPGTRADRGKV